MLPDWSNMIGEFYDAVVVGGDRQIYIFFICRVSNTICVKLPIVRWIRNLVILKTLQTYKKQDDYTIEPLPTDHINVAWALKQDAPLEPLVIFSFLNLLYIYNVRRKGIAGYLRGHGGVRTDTHISPTNSFI